MKRILAVLVLLCVLLCGCDNDINIGTSNNDTPTDTTAAATAAQTAATDPTAAAQQPTEALPEKVTVYLLDSAQIFDSGRMEYIYDENDNILSVNIYTIENDLMYTVYFEECDLDGIPASYRLEWATGGGERYTITYTDNAKITELRYDGGNFTGTQFEYDQNGRMTEQRQYYEGILETATYFEYSGGVLVRSYCENASGEIVYQCRVENGLIMEYIYSEEQGGHRRLCEYDKAGNLLSDSYIYDEVTTPGTFYTYRTVEVDANRAIYLVGQQILAMLVS